MNKQCWNREEHCSLVFYLTSRYWRLFFFWVRKLRQKNLWTLLTAAKRVLLSAELLPSYFLALPTVIQKPLSHALEKIFPQHPVGWQLFIKKNFPNQSRNFQLWFTWSVKRCQQYEGYRSRNMLFIKAVAILGACMHYTTEPSGWFLYN